VTLNSTHRYTNTAVLGVERVEAPTVVTSDELDERLVDVYARTKMRGGILQSVVGIHERRRWADGQSFIDGAVAAGRAALALSVDRPQRVTASVVDRLGRRVAVIFDGTVSGSQTLVVDRNGLAAGAYVVRVEGETFAASRPLSIVR